MLLNNLIGGYYILISALGLFSFIYLIFLRLFCTEITLPRFFYLIVIFEMKKGGVVFHRVIDKNKFVFGRYQALPKDARDFPRDGRYHCYHTTFTKLLRYHDLGLRQSA